MFFFSSRRRHTRWNCDWSSDVCSSDLDPSETSLVFPDGLVVGAPRGSRGANSVRLKKYRDVQRTLVSQTQSGPVYHTEARSEERRVGKECRSQWSPI